MKAFAIIAVGLATAACQPEVQSQATRAVIEVTDAVLVKQSTSQVQEDAVRTLLLGKWDCSGLADGINITMKADYHADGSFQSALHMVNNDMDLNVDVAGRWVVMGFDVQQSFTSVGEVTGKLSGSPITPDMNASLKDAIRQLSADPEAVTISNRKFTLTDSNNVVTTCTR